MSLMLVAALLATAVRPASAAGLSYTVTELPVPAGALAAIAYDINDAGQIVGYVTTAAGPNRAYLWQNGTSTELAVLSGYNESIARGINNAGQIAGESSKPGATRGVRWTSVVSPTELAPFNGGVFSSASDINDAGLAVGIAYSSEKRAATWAPGTSGPIAPSTLPAYNTQYTSRAYAINNNGLIVGSDAGYLVNTVTAVGWAGSETPLGSTTNSEAFAVNNEGIAVGQANNANRQPQATLWNNGAAQTLGTLGGYTSYAFGIRNRAQASDLIQVVGRAQTGQYAQHAFIWQSDTITGTITDLNTLIPANSGWSLMEARAINSQGQIVGYGTHNGVQRAFLLTPVP